MIITAKLFLAKFKFGIYDITMKIKSQTALITGSSGKLGYKIAMTLAERGCDCICHYNSNEADVCGLIEKIESLGRKGYPVKADLSDPEHIAKLFETKVTPSIVINSAAVFERKTVKKVTPDHIRKTLDINLSAPIIISQMFATALEDAKIQKGKIVNLTDVGGTNHWGGYSVYCASKAGLISITKSMAKELGPDITVNAVSPGYIDFPDAPAQDRANKQIKNIPLKRLGRWDEVVSAVMFVLENDYINGQVINVDGGRYII